MQADDIIVIGDKVELTLENNQVYKSKVEDKTDSGLILIAVPNLWGTYAPLYIGEEISLGFYRESGWFTTKMEAVSFEKQGEAQFVWLMQMEAPHRHQRRDAYRLPVRLRVKVYEYKDGMEKDIKHSGNEAEHDTIEETNTKDVSIGGISFTTKRGYEPGEKYLLKVFLEESPGQVKPFLVCAEVMRTVPTNDSKVNSIGMQFQGVTYNGSEVLSKYVVGQQQILIKQRRPGDIG